MMAHGQELTSDRPRFDALIPKESSIKLTALYEEEARVDNDQDMVLGDTVPEEEAEATDWCSVCSPHVGGAAVAKAANWKSTSSSKRREDSTPTQPQNALTDSHHFVLL